WARMARIRSKETAMKKLFILILAVMIGAASASAAGKINVVAATTDFAALAQEVGGDKVNVQAIAKGYQDPHFVEAKPSFLLMLHKADLLIVVGLELEIGWLPPLITQSGNPKIQPSAAGYFDSSRYADILEKASGSVSRAEGDVHPYGNPHYWLDPENGRRVAKGISQKLGSMRPNDSAYFQQRFRAFSDKLTQQVKNWDAIMQPYRGRKVITYHRSWPNFLDHFG